MYRDRIWMVVRSWGARSSESFNGCRVSLLRDGKSSKDRWWWWWRNMNIFDATTHLKMVQMVPFILYFTTVKNKYIKFKNYLPCGVIWPHFCVTSCLRLGFVGFCQTLPVGRGDTEGLEEGKKTCWFILVLRSFLWPSCSHEHPPASLHLTAAIPSCGPSQHPVSRQ